MKRGFRAAAVVLAALGFSGCIDGAFGSGERDTVDESRPLSRDGEFSLHNTNGSVRVTTWQEPRVRVEATRTAANRRALERLEVEIEGSGERVSVRTRHPRGPFFQRGGSVAYNVTVPEGARVSVRNVNGRVEIDGVLGPVRAETVNGSIEAQDLGSEIAASTTNGSLEVELDRVSSSGRNRLVTTNGAVRLVLPRDVGAAIEARTVNGSVRCEFELAPGARVERRRTEGRIGGGGARFELRTVNGSVRIDRGFASRASAESPAEEAPVAALR